MSEILLHIAALAKAEGILDETKLRDRLIRLEFEKLKTDMPGKTVEEIINDLADKHYLGAGRVRNICYEKTVPSAQIAVKIKRVKRAMRRNQNKIASCKNKSALCLPL